MGNVPDMRCGPPLPPRLGHALPYGGREAGGLGLAFGGGGGSGGGDADGGEGALTAFLSLSQIARSGWPKATPANVATTARDFSRLLKSKDRRASRAGAGASAPE